MDHLLTQIAFVVVSSEGRVSFDDLNTGKRAMIRGV